MIVVTGALGFIGSCMTGKLNREGFKELVLVDDFSRKDKERNVENKDYLHKVERKDFFDWLKQHASSVQFVLHLGARTDTAEKDEAIFQELNLDYSKKIWQVCVSQHIPLIYASSAATYGALECRFDDDTAHIEELKPLNPYGQSKNDFDKWVLQQEEKPFFWAGFKFFNVYGPNEYHKGRMASVMYHLYKQVKEKGQARLFKSHKPSFENGEQKRDFVYVLDVVNVLYYFMMNRKHSDIYNLGTGQATSYNHLTQCIFDALGKAPRIEYFDIPEDIRDTYQYFTEASVDKLRKAGYTAPFQTVRQGVTDYLTNYLSDGEKTY